LLSCGSQRTEQELRTLLGCFLFSGDDVDKKIRVLSGGEKARVALAKTIVSKANFLILDEPTNHLDMHSVDLLVEALNKYKGSLILVSHDRYFISKAANKIWEIDDQKVKEFKGGYEEWVEWKERMAKQAEKKEGPKSNVKEQPEVKKPDVKKTESKKTEADPPQHIDKDLKKELQKYQKQFQQAEEKLATLNLQKQQFEAALSAPDTYADKNKFVQTESSYKSVQVELQKLNAEYERLFEKVMELESRINK
jgi:ATP-binding cassette subfamily F protein 3